MGSLWLSVAPRLATTLVILLATVFSANSVARGAEVPFVRTEAAAGWGPTDFQEGGSFAFSTSSYEPFGNSAYAEADAARGLLRNSLTVGYPAAAARSLVYDEFTLSGLPEGTPVQITANLTVRGSVSGPMPWWCCPYVNVFAALYPRADPPPLWASFGITSGYPPLNATLWAVEWGGGDSRTVDSVVPAALNITSGVPFRLVYGLELSANTNLRATADFLNSARLCFDLPAGTWISSQGGFSQAASTLGCTGRSTGEGVFFQEVERDGKKYFCIVSEPWVSPAVNQCVTAITFYTDSPTGLDLANHGATFPGALGLFLLGPALCAVVQPDLWAACAAVTPLLQFVADVLFVGAGICGGLTCDGADFPNHFLDYPGDQSGLLGTKMGFGWYRASDQCGTPPEGDLPALCYVGDVGGAGVNNADAERRCATGRIDELNIGWDGDIHLLLGPVNAPDIYRLINTNNRPYDASTGFGSEWASTAGLVIEIPLRERDLFPNLGDLRGGQIVNVCGQWVTDANPNELWNELHPIDSLQILTYVPDTTPPTLNAPQSPLVVEATGPSGAVVTYSVTATDAGDGLLGMSITPQCKGPASGSTFPLGETAITCTAEDSARNTATASFAVRVRDSTPPSVTVPADMTVLATGPGGRLVVFSASAIDRVDGPMTPACLPSSGSTFPVGTTTVTCTATDARGNAGSAAFQVNVLTPQQGLQQFVANQVSLFQTTGVVNSGQANSLLVKLKRAIDNLNEGKKRVACNQLGALVNEITSYVAEGVLTPAQASLLLDGPQGLKAIMAAVPC